MTAQIIAFPDRDTRAAFRESAWDTAMAETLAEYGPWRREELPLWAVEAWASYVLTWRAKFRVDSPGAAPWPELWAFFARREGIERRETDGGAA